MVSMVCPISTWPSPGVDYILQVAWWVRTSLTWSRATLLTLWKTDCRSFHNGMSTSIIRLRVKYVMIYKASDSSTYFSQLGLLAAIQNIGSLCALPFAPYMADGVGRRPTIFFGAVLMIIATVLQTASQSVSMFIGARCVLASSAFPTITERIVWISWMIGFGLTFAHAAAPLLVTEIAYPTQRAQLTSVYNTLWYLGSIMWVVYLKFPGWYFNDDLGSKAQRGLRLELSRFNQAGRGVFLQRFKGYHLFFKYSLSF